MTKPGFLQRSTAQSPAAPRSRAGLTMALGLGMLMATITPAAAAPERPVVETRCGWIINPTPSNDSLLDGQGSWAINQQGGHQAKGALPRLPESKEYSPNSGYGYGCGCLKIERPKNSQTITRIISGKGKPLAVCRKDPKLPSPNPGAGKR